MMRVYMQVKIKLVLSLLRFEYYVDEFVVEELVINVDL